MNISNNLIIGFILLFIGIASLFGANVWNLIWPLILIFIGLKIIYRQPKKYKKDFDFNLKSSVSHEDSFDYSIIFNGINDKIVSKNFKGGEFNSIFGGGEIDLSECKIPEGKTAVIKVSLIFGGIKLIVPKNWQIVTHITQIAGGFENKTKSAEDVKGKLIIEGSAIFGGGEIVNG